jgi:hypothetical protein
MASEKSIEEVEMTYSTNKGSPPFDRNGSCSAGEGTDRLLLALVLSATLLILTAALAGHGQDGVLPAASAQGAAVWPNIALTHTVGGLSQPLRVTQFQLFKPKPALPPTLGVGW